MPYDLYTTENLKNRYVDFETCINVVLKDGEKKKKIFRRVVTDHRKKMKKAERESKVEIWDMKKKVWVKKTEFYGEAV